jgi:hypothetical protein
MRHNGLRIGLATGFATVIALLIMPTATIAAGPNDVHRAREATKAFRSVPPADYGLFKDAAHIACIDKPGMGGMGIHYVNISLIQKLVLDPARPSALVYEPDEDGQLRLVALEYIVFAQDWYNAGHNTRPTLFGHQLNLVAAGNRYGIPAFYEIHAWVWKNNPRGMFKDWNPRVSCSED